MNCTWIRLHKASGSTPSMPGPVTKRISRRSRTSRIPSPLLLRDDPTPHDRNRSMANEKASPPAMSSTATTATSATPRLRSAPQIESMRTTASRERMPSGFDT